MNPLKFSFVVALVACGTATAQIINTNVVIISGAGTIADNGIYLYTLGTFGVASSGYTNQNGDGASIWGTPVVGWNINYTSGSYQDYTTGTNAFPATWSTSVGGTAPAPTGTFLIIPAITNWGIKTTNYWRVPGDYVAFSGSGRNLDVPGVSSNQLMVTVDGHPIFTGPWTSGAGLQWSLAGQVQWDGTNFLSSGQFTSGDTNAPAGTDVELFTNVVIGTNAWSWIICGDTNGLTFDAANLVASRYPSNDVPQHLFGGAPISVSIQYFTNAITTASYFSNTVVPGAVDAWFLNTNTVPDPLTGTPSGGRVYFESVNDAETAYATDNGYGVGLMFYKQIGPNYICFQTQPAVSLSTHANYLTFPYWSSNSAVAGVVMSTGALMTNYVFVIQNRTP